MKQSVTTKDYKRLISIVKGADIRESKRENLKITFILLYYTGMRISELRPLKVKDLKTLLEQKELIIKTSKTKDERKIFLSKEFEKALRNCKRINEPDNHFIIQKHSYPTSTLHEKSFIMSVNKFMKENLGQGFTSHSFRQGILTDMAAKQINPKVIMKFINHRSIKTTLRYIKPTDDMVKDALIR